MSQQRIATVKFVIAMLIFGSIGIFVRHISLPSSLIAFMRAGIGVVFLLLVMLFRKMRLSWAGIRRNALLLCISGAAIGFNWILLFESYRFTSVAVGTLCYYMAPMIVLLLSPVILKERLNLRKILCLAAAILGMILISGIGSDSLSTENPFQGVFLGLGAAALYASVMLMNKHIKGIGAFDKTIIQLSVAAVVLIPYNFVSVNWVSIDLNTVAVCLLFILGIVHTGFAYYLYFDSIGFLPGQRIAIFSYIDPVVAVFTSAVLLHEPITWFGIFGAFLIVGSAVISELLSKIRR